MTSKWLHEPGRTALVFLGLTFFFLLVSFGFSTSSFNGAFPENVTEALQNVIQPVGPIDEAESIDLSGLSDIWIFAHSTRIDIKSLKEPGRASLQLRGGFAIEKRKSVRLQTSKVNEGLKILVHDQDGLNWLAKLTAKFNYSFHVANEPHLVLELPNDFSGRLHLTTFSGKIEIQGVSLSSLEAQSVSGAIQLHDATSHVVDIKNQNGRIEVEAVMDDVALRATSGSIDAKVRGHAGDMHLAFATTSGPISVGVSPESSLAVQLRSMSGKVFVEPGLLDANGQLGEGHGLLRAESLSGDVRLTRYE